MSRFSPAHGARPLRSPLAALAVLLAALMALHPVAVFAQGNRDGETSQRSALQVFSRQNAARAAAGAEAFQFDVGTISKAGYDALIRTGEYVVGPGDAFAVVVDTDEGPVIEETFIGAAGALVLPYIGAVEIAGMRLTDARATIDAAVSRRFRHLDIQISLSRLRSFPVTVIGEVKNPGSYLVEGIEQVSQLVLKAGGLLQEGEGLASLRNIQIHRRGADGMRQGSVRTADLLLWNLTGDVRHNPFIIDGDQVFVPVRGDSITISGSVHQPGNYEYAPGDRVSSLITLGRGLIGAPAASAADLLRLAPSGGVEAIVHVDLERALAGDPEKDLVLRPGDKLQVVGDRPRVTVEGEVRFPGAYPIEEGLTLRTLVERAGGFTPFASLSQASVIRKVEYGASGAQDVKLSRLLSQPAAQLTDADRAYLTMKTQQVPGRLPVDFAALFERGDARHDIPLKGEDVVRVPRLMPTVLVNGSVVSPAAIPYDSTYTVSTYIERAGGFTDNAKRGDVYVIQGSTGNSVEASKVARVSPGDAIFVPAKTPGQGWRIFRETLTVVTQIATLVAVIVSIQRQ